MHNSTPERAGPFSSVTPFGSPTKMHTLSKPGYVPTKKLWGIFTCMQLYEVPYPFIIAMEHARVFYIQGTLHSIFM